MNYQQAAQWLTNLTDPERSGLDRRFRRRQSLDPTCALMEGLGNPHRASVSVHVAGTKGKGSVAAMIESAARAQGLTTGLFTSPHLVSWRERVKLDGQPIAEQDLARIATQVRPVAEAVEGPGGRGATFFEVYFAIAMMAFAQRGVDLAVIETGLGGRLDATNVIEPRVSVITTLSLDHTQILGDTIEQIAFEKAGIIKPGVPVVSAPQPDAAMGVIGQTAAERGAPLRVAEPFRQAGEIEPLRPEDYRPGERPRVRQPIAGSYLGERVQADLPLLGEHQGLNAGVAACGCEELSAAGLPIGPDALGRGLGTVHWPARVEVIKARPWLVLDCAHNPDSAAALMRALRRHLLFDRLVLVLGLSKEKDAEGIAAELASADRVILTRADMPRAMAIEALEERTRGLWRSYQVCSSSVDALAEARAMAGERDCICVTGSFFVVGEIMGRALGYD